MSLKVTFHEEFPFGIQKEYKFKNGYGASVICHKGSYGHQAGLWELAILKGEDLCYDTPISNDVIGNLTEAQVENYLEEIKAL